MKVSELEGYLEIAEPGSVIREGVIGALSRMNNEVHMLKTGDFITVMSAKKLFKEWKKGHPEAEVI